METVETIKAPKYVVKASQDTDGDYRNFITYGTHPPKWLFDPEVKSSKGAVGGALVQSNREAYKWNMIRRNIAKGGEITSEQYAMLVDQVRRFDGAPAWMFNKNTEKWFKACKKWVNSR